MDNIMNSSVTLTSALIIDDDPAFQMILQTKLEILLGKPIIMLCSTLKEAREVVKSYASGFDLVLLDQHLPDGRGLDLLKENLFGEAVILAVSSDNDPVIPGSVVGAGATFFLSKANISDPLFDHLIVGLKDRAALNRELNALKIEIAVLDSVKTLVSTLKHEINNPLGGIFGGTFLLKNKEGLTEDQKKAAEIIERSGQRIKHVLDQLCNAMALDKVNKGGQEVFHVPGDKEWE
jgi:signal transduction histidine kinase